MHHTLAKKPGLGCVAICKNCKDVHIAIDKVSLKIAPETFIALSEMMQEALKHPKLVLNQANPKQFMAQQLFSLA